MIIFFSNYKKFISKIGLIQNRYRRILMIILDIILIYFSRVFSIFLISDLNFLHVFITEVQNNFIDVIISLLIFSFTGQYKGITKYVGSFSLYLLTLRCGIISITLFTYSLFFLEITYSFKESILFCILLIFLTGIFRFLIRDLILRTKIGSIKYKKNIAIYGANDSGVSLLNYLSESNKYKVVSFIDKNKNLFGRTLKGIKIKSLSFLNSNTSKIDTLIIPSIENYNDILKEILESIKTNNIEVLKVPSSLEEFSQTNKKDDLIKPIVIEDLLKRKLVKPNKNLLDTIKNKQICITGAGGTIGSEICKQLINLGPSSLILIEKNELSLYKLQNLLKDLNPNITVKYFLGDCSDEMFLEDLFSQCPIDLIYHCAAYKHVPLVEQNKISGLKNNIKSTYNICKISKKNNIEQVLLISSDKAVRPTNIMGASKRVCELILESCERDNIAKEKFHKTKFSIVRFGNVLESSGSVVPLFKKQISRGGPITITDPKIIRYFMTIEEASQLVIQASSQSKGGEIFLLDMGKPVKILDLAKQMIVLSGLTIKDEKNPEGDIEINFIGLRSGEKLYEELLINARAQKTEHELIYKANDEYKFETSSNFWIELEKMMNYLSQWDTKNALIILSKLVPEWKKTNNTINRTK